MITRRLSNALAAALLAAFAVQAITSMQTKSVVADEPGYIAAGYYHLRTGRFDINMTNPPLVEKDGYVTMPQGPGLGVEIDRDLIEKG